MEPTVTDAQPEGFWRYAVREIDEDGDAILWTSYGSYSYEPFTSAQEAHDFAASWIEKFEVLRTWVPKDDWQPVPASEWSRP